MLARISVNNPVFVNLLLLLAVALGLVFYASTPKEVFPSVPLDKVLITTIYKNVIPQRIEQVITIPIENAVKGVDGIKRIESISKQGYSVIILEVEPGMNLKQVAQDVKSAIDRMPVKLPTDAEDPVVVDLETKFNVITVSVVGSAPELILRRVADDLADRIELLKGVSQVLKTGYRDREIWIEVDPHKLYALSLGITDIVSLVKQRNVNVPAGIIRGRREEFFVRTDSEIETLRQLLNTPIKMDTTRTAVPLRSVATARFTFEEATSFGRINGQRSISLTVQKKIKGDTIKIADAVRKLVAEYQRQLPPGIKLELSRDSSVWIKSRLQTMYNSGAWGFLFVCITLFMFLSWRSAIWTALGIPISFMGAIIFMHAAGMTINMLTLFALILVLGIVVDDAIIVSENVHRHLLMGKSPRQAAIDGTDEVTMPVVAAIMTTIAAFLPMLMMTGIMGKFMAVIPQVVTFALLASLIEALLILPSHLADFNKPIPPEKRRKSEGRFYPFLRRRYRRGLRIALRFRYLSLVVALAAALVMGWVAIKKIPFVLFDAKDISAFVINVETPVGMKLDRTADVVAQIERIVKRLPKTDVSTITTYVGRQIDIRTGASDDGSHMAQVIVETSHFDTPGRRNGFVIMDQVRRRLKGVTGISNLVVQETGGGPPVGSPVEVRVRGEDFKRLRQIADEMKAYLRTLPGVVDIADDFNPGKREIIVKPLLEKALRLGISAQAIALATQTSFGGLKASDIRRGRDEIEIIVKLAEKYRDNPSFVDQIMVKNLKGKLVPFRAVAKRVFVRGLSQVRRYERKRSISVTANVNKAVTTSNKVNRLLMAKFADLSRRYPGYDLAFGGEHEEQQESLQSLFAAFLVALLLIFIILGTLFRSYSQPFVVLFALPFGFIGVVVGHLVMDISFSLLSLLGMVAMCGVVVNDSLVLVDFVNSSRRRGGGRWLSIVRGGTLRLRPIILTSVTTMLGLSTLMFRTSGQAGFLAPMAIAMVWGLAFGTVLTLYLVPCVLAINDDFRLLFMWLKRVITRQGPEDRHHGQLLA
jgi:multidrug efflux pump subunit AcrB